MLICDNLKDNTFQFGDMIAGYIEYQYNEKANIILKKNKIEVIEIINILIIINYFDLFWCVFEKYYHITRKSCMFFEVE